MKGPTNSSARPNIRLLNVSATFESNPDAETNADFPYRATIDADGVTNLMSATVMFSQIQAISGNFATYSQTDTDKIYVYSKTDVGTITIPAVSCDLSVNYINVDNVPTEDSQAVITSGGVYSALESKLTKGASLTDGHLLEWDATNSKAIDSGTGVSTINTAINGKVSGTGNIGDDARPIKIVNGVAIAVSTYLQQDPHKVTNAIGESGYPTFWTIQDRNGSALLEFKLYVRADNGANFYVRIRNRDGTWKDVTLAEGNQ